MLQKGCHPRGWICAEDRAHSAMLASNISIGSPAVTKEVSCPAQGKSASPRPRNALFPGFHISWGKVDSHRSEAMAIWEGSTEQPRQSRPAVCFASPPSKRRFPGVSSGSTWQPISWRTGRSLRRNRRPGRCSTAVVFWVTSNRLLVSLLLVVNTYSITTFFHGPSWRKLCIYRRWLSLLYM